MSDSKHLTVSSEQQHQCTSMIIDKHREYKYIFTNLSKRQWTSNKYNFYTNLF